MIVWIAILALLAAGVLVSRAGGRKALASAGGRLPTLHSLPGYHGLYAALWAAGPPLLILLGLLLFGGRLETAILANSAPPVVRALPAERAEVFYADAEALSAGRAPQGTYEPEMRRVLDQTAVQARGVGLVLSLSGAAGALLLGGAGFFFAWRRIGKDFRARNRVEGWIGVGLGLCSVVAVLAKVGIVASLTLESLRFFQRVSPVEFLFGLHWSPLVAMRADQVASEGEFGIAPLFAGTFLITFIAMAVAAPVGLFSAIYLSEYAGPRTRAVVKPLLEVLAGVPTVVYGFFAALTVGPLFRGAFNALGARLLGGPLNGLGEYLGQVQNQMALVAGAVMGIMLIPFVSSLSDDIINAVPQSLRDGSYAMGATPSETIKQVVLPAALPGVMAVMLLAVSRAIGETMIVTMAAGLQARLTANPLDTVTTVTVQIVTLLTGDQEFNSPKTLAAFGLGLVLFLVTLALNILALRIVRKYREQYE
jgi:phosphate transport system permease protein